MAGADGEGVTVGELYRATGRIEKAVDDGFRRVDEQFATLRNEFVSKELYESERDALQKQIEESKESRKWLVTTAIAVLATVADAFYFLTHIHS